jgi:hypothetical protein
MLRARVVSTWRTTSRSKSSTVEKGSVEYFFQAARWGSGMDAGKRVR